MKRKLAVISITGLLMLSAHRLPAPIQESQETPSPTPIPAPSATAAVIPTGQLPKQQAARFTGTWNGKIKFGRFGDVDFTLVINPQATSLIQKSRFGELAHPTSVNAGALSWIAGEKGDHAWTLTPNPDGQSALIKLKLPSGVETTATFQRTESPSKRGRAGGRAKARQ